MLETPRTFSREGIKLALVTFTLIAVAFVVIQYVAPTVLAGGRLVTDAGNEIEPRELTLP